MNPSPSKPSSAGDRLDAFVEHLSAGDVPAGEAIDSTQASAALVRSALVRAALNARVDDARAEDALMATWQRQGLLSGATRARNAGTRWAAWLERLRVRPGSARWLAPASAAALVTLVFVYLPRPDDGAAPQEAPAGDAGTLRGAEQAVALRVADPAALVARLERLFTERGIKYRVVSGGAGVVAVQAQLAGQGADLQAALAELGVPMPTTGRLNLLISKAGPPSSP